MNKVFIHCGAPKTGSSYQQVLFARYADALAERGVIYPSDASVAQARRGEVTSGNGVEMANYLRPDLPHNIPDKDAFLGRFRQLLAQNQGKDLLFSSEFIVFPDNARTEQIAGAMRDAGFQPQIIYLVRDFATAARSTYSQQVKRHGEARSFSEFARTWDPYYLHHAQLIMAAFGAENLLMYNYEEEKDTLADLFFRRILGVEFPVEGDFSINRSLSDKEIELLRTMNGFFPEGQGRMSTFVSDALLSIPKEQIAFGLTPDEHAYFKLRFENALTKLNIHIRGQKIRLSPRLVETRDTIPLGDFEMAMVAIMARLITHSLNKTS